MPDPSTLPSAAELEAWRDEAKSALRHAANWTLPTAELKRVETRLRLLALVEALGDRADRMVAEVRYHAPHNGRRCDESPPPPPGYRMCSVCELRALLRQVRG